MKPYRRDASGDPIDKDGDASIWDAYRTIYGFSESDDDDSSSGESFDEDDMYDGLENKDDIIYRNPDSDTRLVLGSVCLSRHVRGPER
jgi:hypothetical protein